MNRAFIAKPKLVTELLSHLVLHEQHTWEPIYIDPQTEIKWVGYRLDDNPGDQPPNKLRLHNLSLSIACQSAAYTNFDDEAAAAGHYIRWSVPSDVAFEELITALETAWSLSPTERTYRNILISLAWSGLCEPFNFRPIAGKTMQETESDYSYYKSLSNRASKLEEQSIAQLGYEIKRDPNVFKDC